MAQRTDVWIETRKGKKGKTYRVRWCDPHSDTVRSHSCGADKAKAREDCAMKRRQLRNGIGDIRSMSWEDFAKEDVQNLADGGASRNHVKATERTLNDFAGVCRPSGPVDVTAAMTERYRIQLVQRGLSNPTINKNLRELKASLARAVERNYIRQRPVIKMLREKRRILRTLSIDEKKKLINACPDQQWKTFVYLAMTTGMRRKELVSLTWENVDLERRTIEIINSKGHDRVAPLVSSAVDMLGKLRQTGARIGGPMFVRDDGVPYFLRMASSDFGCIVKAAGIRHCTLHDLRRTFCTDLARGGVNQVICQALAGHVSGETTAKFYQAVDDEMRRAAVATVELDVA